MGTRLFIGNLSYNVTEQELREAFTGEGIELRSVRVALDRETGRPRGFAFVETATDDGAKAVDREALRAHPAGAPDHRRGGAGQARRATARWLRRPAPTGEAASAAHRAAPAAPAGPARPGGPGGSGGRGGGFGGPRRPGGGPGGPPRDFGPPRGPGGFRPAASGGPGAAPARGRPHRAASVPRRSARPGPSRRSASGATGAGTATRTTSRARARAIARRRVRETS